MPCYFSLVFVVLHYVKCFVFFSPHFCCCVVVQGLAHARMQEYGGGGGAPCGFGVANAVSTLDSQPLGEQNLAIKLGDYGYIPPLRDR